VLLALRDVIRRREEKTNPRKNMPQADQPSLNLGLKDGQTFKVNIKTSSGSRVSGKFECVDVDGCDYMYMGCAHFFIGKPFEISALYSILIVFFFF
jgi:hypothetical protein